MIGDKNLEVMITLIGMSDEIFVFLNNSQLLVNEFLICHFGDLLNILLIIIDDLCMK